MIFHCMYTAHVKKIWVSFPTTARLWLVLQWTRECWYFILIDTLERDCWVICNYFLRSQKVKWGATWCFTGRSWLFWWSQIQYNCALIWTKFKIRTLSMGVRNVQVWCYFDGLFTCSSTFPLYTEDNEQMLPTQN